MRRTKLAVPFVFACLTGLVALLLAPSVRADESIIKNPGDHPSYRFEAEPHGLIGFGGPFRGGKGEPGVGFRGTVIIVDNGFVKTINNSVGISFGADVFFTRGQATLFLPVAMQWNFWLSPHWSVFGEPGLGLAPARDRGRDVLHPAFWAGGRYHFNDKIALTMRLGYPAFSIGASFLF
jgi:hypothetical protein